MWKPGIEVVKNKIDKFAPKMFCRQLNLVLLLLYCFSHYHLNKVK